MGIISRQIGWSQESNLLWQILKQLNKLTSIMFGLKPKYKVYTALLTQTGGSSFDLAIDVSLVTGITYEIIDNDDGTANFTNVGAPNNTPGTFFVATGTTPNSWGNNLLGQLRYDSGAPVVTVLENTIGNIWFTYTDAGEYKCNSDGLFTSGKTLIFLGPGRYTTGVTILGTTIGGTSSITIYSRNTSNIGVNGLISSVPVEIRVYN
jgi:hypothetical protein